MDSITLFIQTQGSPDIGELYVPNDVSESGLYQALAAAEALPSNEFGVFLDEAEEEILRDCDRPMACLKHGIRVHVVRCRRVSVSVNFNDCTIEREFAPGTRLQRVKAWAIRELKIDRKDATEYVLQQCDSTERPAGDTPLHCLVECRDCSVCFDLVPEKRIEGAV